MFKYEKSTNIKTPKRSCVISKMNLLYANFRWLKFVTAPVPFIYDQQTVNMEYM
jgi:hypothetical protein